MTNTKKKNGNKRKLLGAVGMLTVSAAMLVSSTFAWFSLNKKVTASTMQVRAQSRDPFLQIKASGDTNFATETTNLAQLTSEAKLYLVAPTSISGTTVAWGSTFSTNPAEVQETKTVDAVATDKLSEYVLEDTLTLKNASTTTTAEEVEITTVTITPTTGDKIAPAARILFVWAEGHAMYNGSGTLIDGTDRLPNIAPGGTKELKVYMYFDGTDTASYTNNMDGDSFKNVDASFVFTLKEGEDHHATATATPTPGYTFPTVATAAP